MPKDSLNEFLDELENSMIPLILSLDDLVFTIDLLFWLLKVSLLFDLEERVELILLEIELFLKTVF